jgi:cytochrome c
LKKVALAIGLFGIVAANARADEPISYAEGGALMATYKCSSCHAPDSPLHGPSLRAMAKKYASDPNAQGELETRVLNGSAGIWGTNSVMPPSVVPQHDLHILIEWILSLR